MSLIYGFATGPDLIRLIVVPVFAWAAIRDIRTRRVPNYTWLPLIAIGLVALVWDGVLQVHSHPFEQRLFLIQVFVSLGFVAPLGYLFWRIGGFGGADAKAVITLAIIFPFFPLYVIGDSILPVVHTALGVFSLTILTNSVLVGLVYPFFLGARNVLHGHISRRMFFAKPVPVLSVTTEYGRLLDPNQGLIGQGLDLDALRMYLEWRGVSFRDLRQDPDRYRHPWPTARNVPGDGGLADKVSTDGGVEPAINSLDQWSAERFLGEYDAYGTTPKELRRGLERLVDPTQDTVWITPGIPFIVPMFVGLLLAITFGDILFALLGWLGLV